MVVTKAVREVVQRLMAEGRQARSLQEAHAEAARLGLNPPPMEQITVRRPRPPSVPGISQREVGVLLGGYSERQISRWESGALTPSLDVGTRLTLLLGLHPASAAWLLGVWHPQTVTVDDVPPIWAGVVQHLPAPAYLATAITWEIKVANEAHHALFPWAAPWAPRPETCILRMMMRPESLQSLVRWREDWARPMIDLIMSALHAHPNHTELREQVSGVLADYPEARELWAERESIVVPRLHPDTDVRQVRHPEHGVMDVVPLLSEPEGARGLRLVMLAPAEWKDAPPSELYGQALAPEDVTEANLEGTDEAGE